MAGRLLAAVGEALAVSRRSYSSSSSPAAAARAVSRRPGGVIAKGEEKVGMRDVGDAATSWVPDPVTGYYRPNNRAAEVDVAELRRMLLKQKN